MKRIQGSGLLVECVNPRLRKYIIRWDVKPYINEEGLEQGVDYYEQWVTHKPSMDEVKDIVTSGYNRLIDQRILYPITNGVVTLVRLDYESIFRIEIQTFQHR